MHNTYGEPQCISGIQQHVLVQGLLHLTSLRRLTLTTCYVSPASAARLLSMVVQLTTLRFLGLPALADWPSPSPLSALRYQHLSTIKPYALPAADVCKNADVLHPC